MAAANESSGGSRPVVYRLQGIPEHAETFDDVKGLLFDGRQKLYDVYEPEIFSLATSIAPAPTLHPTKVATLMFTPRQSGMRMPHPADRPNNNTESLDSGSVIKLVNSVKDGLVLDADFLGLTPLNDVAEDDRRLDFVAISGIGSHPFGSWQPHGADKRFMWLRDALPRTFPFARVLLYGYETELQNSNSFQRIRDISGTMIRFLEILSRNSARHGQHELEQRRIVFIAHSLGGIVLQEALVELAPSFGIEPRDGLFKKVLGAIFFGVPTLGMAIEHLICLADGRPNQQLIEDLKRNSSYLDGLWHSFGKILGRSDKMFLWGYETKESRIPMLDYKTKKWTSTHPNAPFKKLVEVDSATRGLNRVPTRKHETFQIDEEHSNMVKFVNSHDKNWLITVSSLNRILERLYVPTSVTNNASPESIFANQMKLPDWFAPPAKESLVTPFKLATESPSAPSRLPSFGREDDLNEMANKLREVEKSQSGPAVLSVHGSPGIGKTQLVAHYIAKHRNCYDNVFYLDASTTSTLWRTLRTETGRLGTAWSTSIMIALSWKDNFSAHVDRFCSFLHSEHNRRWLLIINGMRTNSDAQKIVDRLTTGTIILISVSSCFAARYPSIRVGPLSQKGSSEAMQYYAKAFGIDIAATDVEIITSSLDRHPSLICLAAENLHTLKSANRSVDQCAQLELPDRLTYQIESVMDNEFPNGLPLSQQEILNMIVFFDYRNISSEFLNRTGLPELRLFYSTTSAALSRNGLIDIGVPSGGTHSTYRVSALLLSYIRRQHEPVRFAAALSRAASVLAKVVPRSSNDGCQGLAELLVPHCRALASFVDRVSAISTPNPVGYLEDLERIASCFRILGDDRQAVTLYGYIHRAVTADPWSLRVTFSRKKMGELYNNMGLSWMNEGEIGFATTCFQKSLGNLVKKDERTASELSFFLPQQREPKANLHSISREDLPLIRKVIVNKAWAEIRLESYQEALMSLDELRGAPGIKDDSPAEMHARGYILTRIGENEDGIKMLEQAYNTSRASSRHGKWFAFTILHDLATAYRDQKHWDEAIHRYRQVVDERTLIHGRDHRYTIETISAMAVAYHGSGRQKEAASNFRIALQWHQKHPGHLDGLQTLQNYGAFLADTGDPEAAEQALRLAYDGRCQQELEPKDNASWARVNCGVSLAVALFNLGRYKESVDLLDFAVSWHQGRKKRILAKDVMRKHRAANDYCKALYLRGKTYEAWGNLRAAVGSYSEAVGLKGIRPGETNYWKALAIQGRERNLHRPSNSEQA